MDQVYEGMVVEDARGPIGVVQRVHQANGISTIFVQRNDGTLQSVQDGEYSVAGEVLRISDVGMTTGMASGQFDPLRTQELSTTYASSTSTTQGMLNETTDIAPGQELKIPVMREEVVVGTREVERGGVRVHKTVNEREEIVEQPTYHEDVNVERVAIGRVIDAAPGVREEGDTLIIPVVEEMIVVEKRLVLKEEVRITKVRSQDVEQARVVLREEQVQIEQINERGSIT